MSIESAPTSHRDAKLSNCPPLTKHGQIRFTKVVPKNGARLLIDHPASGSDWTILGQDPCPGFYRLETSIPIRFDYYDERMQYQRFELLLPDNEFERIHERHYGN
jgi:hypothetical protein